MKLVRTLAPRLGLLVATVLSLPAAAEPSFDGIWDVRFVTESGPCGASHASAVAIRGGSIRPAEERGTSVSGGVRAGGAVSAAISNALAQGNASGRLSARAGSGVWNVASLGCTGRWTASRRQTLAASGS